MAEYKSPKTGPGAVIFFSAVALIFMVLAVGKFPIFQHTKEVTLYFESVSGVKERTTVSYDQFFVLYKGDSSFQLAGANYTLNTTTTPVSLGVDVLGGTTTCGSTSTA